MAKRTYETDELQVHWDSDRCIHTGWCTKNLISVFNTEQRPWIQLDKGERDAIIETIEKCPSGALSYTRVDGGPDEEVQVPATIIPWPNGPYFVRGSFQVTDRHGEVFDTAPRATLCRCGQSSQHPFCDNTHKKVSFRSYPRVSESETAEG